MVWKIFHDTLKWVGISFFPLIGFIFTAGLGFAQAFPEYKPWLVRCFDRLVAISSNGLFWPITCTVFLLWFTGLILCNHKLKQLEGDRLGDTYNVHGAPGGYTFGRVDKLQLGQQRFELTDEIIDQFSTELNARWPNIPIEIEGVGGTRSNEIAAQLSTKLRQRGFTVLGEIGVVAFYFQRQSAPIYSRLNGDVILISVDVSVPM
ncbi:hypothetical protein J2W22_003705 [Sphingomonas kyeonggiensis]|uniref:hypothetical protein n=1 Tax=Sphingomonas kyeonggiensis TaxID=1268553 RepID=UPI002780CFCE|nr:hypothetical protein [Sphingomonas kyeonggiensis]MDQ0251617.1 hypothetical protein [Sphingomonas kyeonggiensis]